MFTFSIIRAYYKVFDDIELDYKFPLYFSVDFRENLKNSVCVDNKKICEVCRFKELCFYTKLFEEDLIGYQSPAVSIRLLHQEEKIKKDGEITFEFTFFGNTIKEFNVIYNTLKRMKVINSYPRLALEKITFYNPFSETEWIINSENEELPRLTDDLFWEFILGSTEFKVKIFPAFLNLNLDLSKPVVNEILKEKFIKTTVDRLREVCETFGYYYPITLHRGNFNIEFIYFKEISVKDVLLQPVIDKFKDYKFYECKIQIEGDLIEIYPLFEIMSILNIGKLTNLGFGRVKVIKP